jgi:hypothetical protein
MGMGVAMGQSHHPRSLSEQLVALVWREDVAGVLRHHCMHVHCRQAGVPLVAVHPVDPSDARKSEYNQQRNEQVPADALIGCIRFSCWLL